MKKLLLIAALMTAFACQAEKWEPVADDEDGVTTMLIDRDSVIPAASQDGYPLILADFVFIENKVRTPVTYLIGPESCMSGHGVMLARANVDGTGFKTVGKYNWSFEGEHLYDYAGIAMCVIAKEKMDAANPAKEPTEKKSKPVRQGTMA